MTSRSMVGYAALAAGCAALVLSFRSAGHYRDPATKPPGALAGRDAFTPRGWRYVVLARALGGVAFLATLVWVLLDPQR